MTTPGAGNGTISYPQALLTVVAVERHDRRVRIAFAGEIDQSSSVPFATALAEHVGAPEVRCLEVDLAEVSFLDSSGLNALVGSRNAALDAGRTLVVTRPHDNVRRVLEISGLELLLAPAAG